MTQLQNFPQAKITMFTVLPVPACLWAGPQRCPCVVWPLSPRRWSSSVWSLTMLLPVPASYNVSSPVPACLSSMTLVTSDTDNVSLPVPACLSSMALVTLDTDNVSLPVPACLSSMTLVTSDTDNVSLPVPACPWAGPQHCPCQVWPLSPPRWSFSVWTAVWYSSGPDARQSRTTPAPWIWSTRPIPRRHRSSAAGTQRTSAQILPGLAPYTPAYNTCTYIMWHSFYFMK